MSASSEPLISLLSVDSDEFTRIQQQAEARGYERVEDFVRALIAADAKRPQVNRQADALREALQDVISGRTLTTEQMWREMAEEEAVLILLKS